MNLIVIHGNGLQAISNKLKQIKQNFDPTAVIELSYQDQNLNQLLGGILTPQLFSDKRLIIIQNVEGLDDFNLERLDNSDDTLTLVLILKKTLSSQSLVFKQITKLKGQLIQLTEKDEKLIFPFLEDLANKNPKVLAEIDFLLANYGFQYILTMLCFMFRRLINTPKNLPEFVLAKIARQKNNFPVTKIRTCLKDIIETDFKIKSGLIEEKIALSFLLHRILNVENCLP